MEILKELLDAERVDRMSFGMFRNKSYFGFGSNILKSGICKFYRRKIFDKFEWCVVEMVLFMIGSGSLLTNLINRLKILLMEEIVFVEIDKIIFGIRLLNGLEKLDSITILEHILEFIEIVKMCRRGRLCSYMNNWWRYYKGDLDFNISLDKVNKYKKKGDDDELLKLGEMLIESIEERNEKIFYIYMKMMYKKGKYGNRFKRKDGVYLFWEILFDYFGSNKIFKEIMDFGLVMFNRKSMKERNAFGIWMCLYVWKYDEIDWECGDIVKKYDREMVMSYIKNRESITIDEKYVVCDYHISKKFGMESFKKEGCKVIEEDLNLLGDKAELYREVYMNTDLDIVEIVNREEVDEMEVEEVVDENLLEKINWDEFKNVKVLEKGVCGLKVCCIYVEWKRGKYILKEMRKSFNYGRDYMCLDGLKRYFGIRDMEMKRIKSNKGLARISLEKKTFVGNWKFEERDCVYCVMNFFENIGDLGKNKGVMSDKNVMKECVKIRLFDGLFRSSDNILRNILVDRDNNLLSIDEGDIFGKRKIIFNKVDWCKGKFEKSLVDEIIDEWRLMEKIELVEKRIKLYKFDRFIEEMKHRFENYKTIVYNELNF